MNNLEKIMEFKELPVVKSIGSIIFLPAWTVKFHSDHNHEMLHVIKGEMELTYEDGSKYLAGAGDTLLNPAETMHKDVFKSSDELEVFFILFSWEHGDCFFSKVKNESIKEIATETHSEIKRIFDIMRYDTGFSKMDRVIANSRLMNILLLLYRDIVYPCDITGKSKQQMLVHKAKNYIDRFFRNPINLKDVAGYLQVSPSYLSRIFSHESDFSLVEYLTEVRINEAKKILLDGRYIVADVAQMVGYKDSNYFSKIFKCHVGCSPGKYS
jgi:YesN/AraC family two-component response regulator